MTSSRKTRGFTLIEVLISLLILTFGLLGVAKAYLTAGPDVTQAELLTQSTTAANAWWSVEQLQPAPQAWDSKTAVPTAFQGWFTEYAAQLPSLRAVVTTQNDSLGNACSASSCQLQLMLSWTLHGQLHSQTYVFQQGY
jgi:prepilin-type N-terminal cleavage/methylation domain-containing protein